MKRSLLITKDVNYGASISSTVVNTAVTPALLLNGALGIYCIDPSDNKQKLVTDANAGTGLITAAAALTAGVDDFTPYVGTSVAGLPSKGASFSRKGVTVKSSHYAAPVKQVFAVGYTNSTLTGSLNLPSILRGAEAMFKVKDSSVVDEIDRAGDNYSGYAIIDGASGYSILKNLFDNLNFDEHRKVNMEIFVKGTNSFIANTADPTLINGSKIITFAADPNIATGDYITLKGATYQIASEQSATSYTLDRNYQGVSETIDISVQTTSFGTITTFTEFGFKLTDVNFEMFNEFSLSGIFSSATSERLVNPLSGNGTPSKLIVKEKQTWDRVDRIDRRWGLPNSQVDSTVNYDQYIFSVNNDISNTDGSGYAKKSQANINFAFVTGVADTAGKNQSNFEDIVTSLGIAFTTII